MNQAWLSFVLAAFLLFFSSNQAWSNAEILDFNTKKQDDFLVLNFAAKLELPAKLMEAVHNKIPLYLVTKIDLRRKDNFLFYSYYSSQQVYEYTTLFSYSHFDKTYKLHNLRNNNQLEFTDLADVLQTFGNLNNFHLLNRNRLYPGIDYQIRIRFCLNKKRLPASLYTQTFFTQDWDFKTDWMQLDIPAER